MSVKEKLTFSESLERDWIKRAQTSCGEMNLTKEQAESMNKYDLGEYIGKYELKNGRVQQEVLMDPVKVYNDNINSQMQTCSHPGDFFKLWNKYQVEQKNPYFLRNFIAKVKIVCISKTHNSIDLKDIWDMFPYLQENIDFLTDMQKRKKELGL
jgi:hypothetical protein